MNLYEFSIAPKNDKAQRILYLIVKIVKFLFCALTLLVFLLAFMMDNGLWAYVILSVILTFLLFFLETKLYNFYDVSLYSNVITISKVINNRNRRKIFDFTTKQISKIGLASGNSYVSQKGKNDLKTVITLSKPQYNTLCFFVENEGEHLILMPYNEEFLTQIIKSVGAQKLEKELIEYIKTER